MLDIAAIKSAPRASDAPSQDGKKPVQRDTRDEAKQEFQNEYEATAEDTQPAEDSRVTKADDTKKSQTDGTSAEAEDAASGEQAFSTGIETEETDDADIKKSALISGADAKPQDSTRTLADAADKGALLSKEPGASVGATTAEKALNANAQPKDAATELPATKTATAGKTAAESIIMSKAVENATKTVTPMREASHSEGRTTSQPAEAASKLASGNLSPVSVDKPAVGRIETAAKEKRGDLISREMSAPANEQKTPPALTTSQPKPVVSLAQMQAKLEAVGEKTDASWTIPGDLDGLASGDSRAAGSTGSTQLAQILARAETPGMISRQMAEAMQKLPDRPVEISLNPKELGRVRMNISAAEAGITVNIVAERPETLDLMRRNIEQLAREFQVIGYESIDFAFSEGEANEAFSDEQSGDGGSDISQLELISEEDQPDDPQPQLTVSTGVDIRI